MWRSWIKTALVAGSALAVSLGAVAMPLAMPLATATVAPAERPNIVMIMTDDQAVSTMWAMRNVRRLLAEQGTTFRNTFVSYPLCCPSRATYLTGQLAHNHGVLGNHSPYGGYPSLRGRNTLPVWLSNDGYHTAHVGKYLNEYGRRNPREVPPGWDEWHGLVAGAAYRMYGYQINHDGRLKTYGTYDSEQQEYYQTDVLRDLAVDYIERKATGSKPFFLSVAPLAPHVEMGRKVEQEYGRDTLRPAPRHKGDFKHRELPRPPSFNERDVTDKPRHIRRLKPMSPEEIRLVADRYRAQLEALLAVDEMVAAIVKKLRVTGELDNTTIMFTSDNGYLSGEHRIRHGKIHPYDSSIRVPLVIRGPRFPRGRTISQPVSNVDWAPTIVRAARAEARLIMDGRPIQDLVADPESGNRRRLLFETGPKSSYRWYAGVRTARYTYLRHSTGEIELYDRKRDPHMLRSRHADPAYRKVRTWLADRLTKLRSCVGLDCWGLHPAYSDVPSPLVERKRPSALAVQPGARDVRDLPYSDRDRTVAGEALRMILWTLAGLLAAGGVAAGLAVRGTRRRRPRAVTSAGLDAQDQH